MFLPIFQLETFAVTRRFSVSQLVDVAGWVLAEDSYVDEDEIVLTDATGNQVGYVWHPLALAI